MCYLCVRTPVTHVCSRYMLARTFCVFYETSRCCLIPTGLRCVRARTLRVLFQQMSGNVKVAELARAWFLPRRVNQATATRCVRALRESAGSDCCSGLQ